MAPGITNQGTNSNSGSTASNTRSQNSTPTSSINAITSAVVGGGDVSSSGAGNTHINGTNSLNNTANSGGVARARQTGTVPKTKASRKHSVPQEIVAPTRRDLQQHLNDLVNWASSSSSSVTTPPATVNHQQSIAIHGVVPKQRNRTPGEGACFDLDNLSLQDHGSSSRFIPVRPIVRGSFLSDDLHAADHLTPPPSQPLSNAAIGVVIPTTPSSTSSSSHNNHQQAAFTADQSESSHTFLQKILNPLTRQPRTAEATAFDIIPPSRHRQPHHPHHSQQQQQNSLLNKPLDDRIQEIQEYIRSTSCFLNSINQEKLGGPRPQSVASIHSNTPGTPTYDDLQSKVHSSNRNMQMIRDQQNQIMRLQQAAKSQLEDLERAKAQNPTSNLLAQGNDPPNYEEVGQVQQDMSGLMNRMRALTTFIHNQNELASMLGDDLATEDIVAEQAMLQKKLQDLKLKKDQMENLVGELQSLNAQAGQEFGASGGGSGVSVEAERPTGGSINRIVPITMERIVPIEILNAPASNGGMPQSMHGMIQNNNSGSSLGSQATLMNCGDLESDMDNVDSELYDSESLDVAQSVNNSVIGDKIAEINAMKDQLKRLQNMMNTVKLIENKVEGPDPAELAQAAREVDRLINEPVMRKQCIPERPQQDLPSNNVPIPNASSVNGDVGGEASSIDMEPVLSGRVQALHAMTQDLRAQALSLASERDRLREIKDEMLRRKAEEMEAAVAAADAEEKASNRSNSTLRETAMGYDFNRETSEQRKLKQEYEQKKREFELIVKKMAVADEQNRTKPLQNDIRERSNSHTGGPLKMPNEQFSCNGAAEPSNGFNVASGGPSFGRTLSGPCQMMPPAGSATPTQQQMSASIAQLQNHQAQLFQQQQSLGVTSNYNSHEQSQGMYAGTDGLNSQLYPRNGDTLLLQQFIQTQQMLINSISQCNQLLWAQQRELNNLNNAVLMLQERLIKQELTGHLAETNMNVLSNHSSLAPNRSESVPPQQSTMPNVGGSLMMGGRNIANIPSSALMQNISRVDQPSYLRAQSEQPSSTTFFGAATAQFGNAPHQSPQHQQQISPVRIYPMFNNHSMGRGLAGSNGGHLQQHQQLTNNNLIHLNNNLGNNNNNNLTNNLNQMNNLSSNTTGPNNLNNITNNLSNSNRIARVAGNVQNINQPAHHRSLQGLSQHQERPVSNDPDLFGNNILNLNPLNNNNVSTNLNTNTLDHLPPIPHHHNHHPVQQHPHHHMQNTQALNNQVAPGNRAPLNNYWDNFRSYSRQNLLSGNSCKSNEESCASSSSNYISFMQPHPNLNMADRGASSYQGGSVSHFASSFVQQQQQQQPHHPMSLQHMFENNKMQHPYRNILGDLQPAHGDCVSNNNSNNNAGGHGSHNNSNLNNIVNNLCSNNNNIESACGNEATMDQPHPHGEIPQPGTGNNSASGPNVMTLAADILGFHTNPINLGVTEFGAKSKTLPKGNKKRARSQNVSAPMNNTEASARSLAMMNTQMGGDGPDVDNRNLASATAMNPNSKSTSKFFESLRENVFMEVSALIQSNDLRPYFLIQLFRDLQLMSSSDPMRHQTLQSIQNLYNRYVESTIQEEASMFGGNVAATAAATATGGEFANNVEDNRVLVNDLRMAAKMENESNREILENAENRRERSSESINSVEEGSLRRQMKRRLQDYVNGMDQTMFSCSSAASSQSTPIRPALNERASVMNGSEEMGPKFMPTSSSSSSESSSSLSTDYQFIRIVMKEIAEYLQSVDMDQRKGCLPESVLQRVAKIIEVHLNNSINERLLMTNCRRIDSDRLLQKLRRFSRKEGSFLKRVEMYLVSHFFDETDQEVGAAKEDLVGQPLDGTEDAAEGEDEEMNVEVLLNNNEGVKFAKKQNNTSTAINGDGYLPVVPPRQQLVLDDPSARTQNNLNDILDVEGTVGESIPDDLLQACRENEENVVTVQQQQQQQPTVAEVDNAPVMDNDCEPERETNVTQEVNFKNKDD